MLYNKQSIIQAVQSTIKKDHLKPRMLLPGEWAALFIHYIIVERGLKKRKYQEISPRELTKLASRFAARWKSLAPEVSDAEILDYCFNQGWLVPSAGDTWVVREDLVRY